MISSFFNKAKPVHFLIVGIMLLSVFVWTKISMTSMEFSFSAFFNQAMLFGLCMFSVLLLDFVTEKNNLTQKNSFRILFFVLFFAMFPQTFLNSNALLANVLILLALRRIISMRSHLKLKKKLLDSAVLISLATLVFFWSCLFFLLIFVALFLFRIVDTKNWIIPFIGVSAVAVIVLAVQIVIGNDTNTYFNMLDYSVSFDFTNLNSMQIIISTTIVLSYFIWSLFFYLKNLKGMTRNHKISHLLVFVKIILATIILIIAPNKSGAEFIFMFAPLSIILTNYVEKVPEKWFKEILVWILILTPVVGLIL